MDGDNVDSVQIGVRLSSEVLVRVPRPVEEVVVQRLEVGLTAVAAGAEDAPPIFVDEAAAAVNVLEVGKNLREAGEGAEARGALGSVHVDVLAAEASEQTIEIL